MTLGSETDAGVTRCGYCGGLVHWSNATPVHTSLGVLAICPPCLHPSPERP